METNNIPVCPVFMLLASLLHLYFALLRINCSHVQNNQCPNTCIAKNGQLAIVMYLFVERIKTLDIIMKTG